MIDNYKSGKEVFQPSVTVDINNQVLRKFINSAVYVEKPLDLDLPSYRQIYTDFTGRPHVRKYSIKRCCCAINPEHCPCHLYKEEFNTTKINKQPDSGISTTSSSITSSKSEVDSRGDYNELKLLLSPDSQDDQPSPAEQKNKEDAFKAWLAKKEADRKKREAELVRLREEQERQREELLERERENFKQWLEKKKKQEMMKSKMKVVEREEEKLKELQKKKRQLQNEIRYQNWLREKEKRLLDEKIKAEARLAKIEKDKQRRIEENDVAFKEWCKSAKNKQKPVPMNQGLESLKSSVSVAYINPIPWNSHLYMDESNNSMKPRSQ